LRHRLRVGGCQAGHRRRQSAQRRRLRRRAATAIHSARQTRFRLASESAYTRRMSRQRPFRVGRSRTGLGLFATAPIKKRARIAEYKGRRLGNPEAEKLEARGNRYLYELNSRWTIDGTTRRNIARYANHSCRPNAESY